MANMNDVLRGDDPTPYEDDEVDPDYEAWQSEREACETDRFTERDEAPLVKPQPKGVQVDGWDV